MIKTEAFTFKTTKFPCGELNVHIDTVKDKDVNIEFTFTDSDSIIELLLICDAAKRLSLNLCYLCMSYVPFSRQDRVMQPGEALSIKVFADLINNLGFYRVFIEDAHSPVTTALIDNCFERKQEDIFKDILEEALGKEGDISRIIPYLISPDGGALKKIYSLAKLIDNLGVIECTKERDVKTGDIKRTVVHHKEDLKGRTCVIVDDICDGGRTFIEIAKALKAKGSGKIILCVTHGFFTKSIQVFNNLIDEIYTCEGKVK